MIYIILNLEEIFGALGRHELERSHVGNGEYMQKVLEKTSANLGKKN